jgi:hypothetical protein
LERFFLFFETLIVILISKLHLASVANVPKRIIVVLAEIADPIPCSQNLILLPAFFLMYFDCEFLVNLVFLVLN